MIQECNLYNVDIVKAHEAAKNGVETLIRKFNVDGWGVFELKVISPTAQLVLSLEGQHKVISEISDIKDSKDFEEGVYWLVNLLEEENETYGFTNQEFDELFDALMADSF